MSLQIGRVGITAPLTDPEQWTESGDRVTVSGHWYGVASVAQGQALRQQLQGYIGNPWESIIPVIWSVDSTRSGFYRVTDVRVDTTVESLVNGIMPYTIGLQRVTAYTAPLIEAMVNGTTRATGLAAPGNPQAWHAVPSTATAYDVGAARTIYSRTGIGGLTASVFATNGIDLTYYNATPTYLLSPGSWYDMAATMTINGYVVTGRQIVSNPGSWQLDNGLIKITQGTGHLLRVTFPNAAQNGWSATTYDFDVGFQSAGTITFVTAAQAVQVLRNCPEEVVLALRCSVVPSAGQIQSQTIKVGLRRGSRFVNCQAAQGTNLKAGVQFATQPTACTAITGGGAMYAAADGDNNRAILMSTGAPLAAQTTYDTTNGKIYLTTAYAGLNFGLGYDRAAWSFPDDKVSIWLQYIAGQSETQVVVAPRVA